MATTTTILLRHRDGYRSNIRALERFGMANPLTKQYLPRNRRKLAEVEAELERRGAK